MFTQRFVSILMLLSVSLMPMGIVQQVLAGCEPWGANTLRGDVQGLETGFGIIEISPPDEFVYAVIDGGTPTQQFTQIKAKLRNRITNLIMGPGSVTAYARYHLRTDYATDLSADPPTKQSRQEKPVLSISAPAAVDTIDSDTPLEIVFDFAAQPIPVGITDLHFAVVFYGDIEGAEDPIAAIGIKDLNEPHHVIRWNNTDWFLVNYQWRTGAQIRSTSTLMDFISDNCFYMEPFVDPMDIELFVGFTAGELDAPVYVVHYQNIPPGRFGRVIFLGDAEDIWMHARSVTHNPNDTLTWKGIMPGITNQVDATGFTSTMPYPFRGVIGHSSVGWSWTCPSVNMISSELADDMASKPPAGTDTIPVTTITFP